MVKLPTSLGGKKEKAPETLETKLGDMGVHIIKDGFFSDRLTNNKVELTERLKEETIDIMQISETRKRLLKEVTLALRYISANIPFGKARENKEYARGAMAARKLLLHAQNAIMSGGEDKQIERYCNSILAREDMLVYFTFDSENVSINKSIVVQTVSKHDDRYGGEEEEV